MNGEIRGGDVIVCRVNGTSDFYVVGTVVSGDVGELSLRGVSTTPGRDEALGRAYHDSLDPQRVWLFDGAASGYVKASRPTGEDHVTHVAADPLRPMPMPHVDV